jgi:dihydroflavonol-4-reductase
MTEKTLVTGAGGFIGSHVVRALLKEGRSVRAMLAPGENPINLEGLQVELMTADLTQAHQVHAAVKDCSVVFHLAAIYALWLKDLKLFYEVNVGGTRHIMQACKDENVKKVIHTSSIAAIGVAGDGSPANEETPFSDDHIDDHYVLSKHRSEQEALKWVDEGVPVVVVNPGFPFGAHDIRPTPTGRMIQDLLNKRLPGFPAGGLSAVDVEDVAAGHLLAEKKGRIGERYILTGTNMTYKDFLGKAASVAGVRAPRFQIPTPLAKVMSHGFVLGAKVFGVDPLMTPGLLSYISRPLYYDNRKAIEELGLVITPLEETLEKSIAFFRHR